jgi:hypothetical protein
MIAKFEDIEMPDAVQSPIPSEAVSIAPPAARDDVKDLLRELDDFQRYQIQLSLDLFDRVSRLNEQGNSVYEKLILVDGAAIALSITFLASLSSRLSAIHASHSFPLWMVGVSWVLLLLSIHSAYRVITIRHNHIFYAYRIAAETAQSYIHQHSAMNSVELGKRLAKVELPNGTGTLDFSKAFEALAELSRSLQADATERALRTC